MIPKKQKPQSKPLLILESDDEISSMFQEMETEIDPLASEGEKLIHQLQEVKQKIDKIQSNHWRSIEKKLIERGLIDSKDVSLSLRDGVLYMDPKQQINNLADLFGKLFKED